MTLLVGNLSVVAAVLLLGASAELRAQEPRGEVGGLLLTASGTLSEAPPVGELAPSGDGLLFEIKRYFVEGNTLLDPLRIDRELAAFAGRNRDFGTVQQALEALEKLYADAGYSTVHVILPEQELDTGEILFDVKEGRLTGVVVQGNKHFSEENIRRSVTTLAQGRTPNINEMSDNLRLINEHPAKQATVVMRAGEKDGDVDAVVRVTDQPAARYALSLDNTGNAETGTDRIAFAAQYSNLFDRDHILSFQYVTAPDKHARQVAIFGLGYRIPFYDLNASFDAFYGSSNVDSGQVTTSVGNFLIAGSGEVFSFRYNQNLPKRGEWEHKLSLGMDVRYYQASVRSTGSTTNLVPDITVNPVSLTYQGLRRRSDSELSGYFSIVHNLPGGSDGNDAAFQKAGARPGANALYALYRYGFNWVTAMASDWQVRVNFSGQHTRQMLVSGEQFGIGGADSVRGYRERAISNDKGHRGTIELYTPDWGNKVYDDLRVRALAFYDFGRVERVHPLPKEIPAQGAGSVGVGLRGSLGKNLNFRLDAAEVVHNGGNNPRGMRMHGMLTYVF